MTIKKGFRFISRNLRDADFKTPLVMEVVAVRAWKGYTTIYYGQVNPVTNRPFVPASWRVDLRNFDQVAVS